MNITGKVKIWKKTWENNKSTYSMQIKNKSIDGKEGSYYMPIQLPNGSFVENGAFIDIKRAFLSFYVNKLLQPTVKLIIMEFENIDLENNGVYVENSEKKTDEKVEVSNDDLPF